MRSGVTNGGPVQHNEFILNFSSLAGPRGNARSRSKTVRLTDTHPQAAQMLDDFIGAGLDSGAKCNGSMRTEFARLCQAL